MLPVGLVLHGLVSLFTQTIINDTTAPFTCPHFFATGQHFRLLALISLSNSAFPSLRKFRIIKQIIAF